MPAEPHGTLLHDLHDLMERLRSLRERLSTAGAAGDVTLSHALLALADEAERVSQLARTVALLPASARQALPAARAASGRPRVLVVEDDRVTLDAMAALLADDFEVIAALDALDGLARARRPPVDAVVTDLHMPGVDGRGLLRMLHAEPGFADVPCLLLSADATAEEKLSALDEGVADYLTKPVDIDELIARLHKRIAEARRLARERALQETDDLTGLPNRRALRRCLSIAFAAARVAARPLALALVDADGLKQINDTWGHGAGDLAIRRVAEVLQGCKRGNDCAARLGGDEFAVLMPGTDLIGAQHLVARVNDELERSTIAIGDTAVALRVCCGVATVTDDDRDIDALLARADQALYACKRQRRPSTPPPLQRRTLDE